MAIVCMVSPKIVVYVDERHLKKSEIANPNWIIYPYAFSYEIETWFKDKNVPVPKLLLTDSLAIFRLKIEFDRPDDAIEFQLVWGMVD